MNAAHTQTNCRTLIKRSRTASILGVSESQVLKFERAGVLTPIPIPGIRAVRNDEDEVIALQQSWIEAAKGGAA